MTNTKPTWDWQSDFEIVLMAHIPFLAAEAFKEKGKRFEQLKAFIQKVEQEAYERGRQIDALKMDCQKCGKDFGENKEWMLLLRHKEC